MKRALVAALFSLWSTLALAQPPFPTIFGVQTPGNCIVVNSPNVLRAAGFDCSGGPFAKLNGDNTYTGLNTFTNATAGLVVSNNQNAVTGAAVFNTSAGGSATAAWGVNNGTALGNFGIGGTGYTAVPFLQNKVFMNASGGAGIALLTNDAQPIGFGTNLLFRGSIAGNLTQWLISPTNAAPANTALMFAINKNTVACPQKPAATIVNWMVQFCGADAENLGVMIDTFGTGTNSSFGALSCRRSNGTAAAPTALKSGDLVCVFGGLGAYGNSLWSLDQWQIRYYAAQDWNVTSWGSDIAFLTTPNGSTTAAEGMRLTNAAFLGVGTTTAQSKLHVNKNTTQNSAADADTIFQLTAADATTASMLFSAFGASGNYAGTVYSQAGGTAASPSQTGTNTVMGYVGARARTDAAAYTAVGAQFSFETSQAQTAAAQGKRITVYTTPNGSTTVTASSRFENSGGITVPPTVTGGDKGVGSVNATTLFQANVPVVTTARAINTTSPITGGGDLSADRTIALTGTVAIANGGTNDTGTAFTNTTTAPTCNSGTFTTAVTSTWTKTLGKTVFISSAGVSITTNGTCAGAVRIPLGFTSARRSSLSCDDGTNTVQGQLLSGNSFVQVYTITGTYPGADGRVLTCSGVAEST